MKVTNLDLFNIIKELKLEVKELRTQINNYENFDPIPYVERTTNITPIWLHDGIYHSNPSDLYEIVCNKYGYTSQLRTFRILLNDPSRINELKKYQINLVYLAALGDKHGITTSGHVVRKPSLHILKSDLNRVVLTENGERFLINVGVEVYQAFVDPTYEPNSLHYRDGNMLNNRIDNLEPHHSSYKK